MNTELMTQDGLERVTGALIPITESIRTLVIKSPAELQIAANIRGSIKDYLKKIDAYFKPLEDNAKAQVKAIKDKKDLAKGPAVPLVEQIDLKVKVYTDAEDLKIALAEAKQWDEQCKIAAEKQRKVDELNAKELKARQEADEKAAKLREAGKTAQAQAVLDAGNKKAEALQEKAAEVLLTPVESKTVIPERAKVDGMHYRANYSVEIVNPDMVERIHLIPDMQKLNRMAREQKESFSEKGCKLVTEKTPVNVTRNQED